MTIQQFIEKSIEGGWKPTNYADYNDPDQVGGLLLYFSTFGIEKALLDPEAWKAVGKVEEARNSKWRKSYRFKISDDEVYSDGRKPGWFYYWYRMINALTEGRTIEEYIATL